MKKFLLFLLIFLPLLLLAVFFFLNRQEFICPVFYKGAILIRCDNRGEGFFGAERNGNRLHEGLDLYAPTGTPVAAVRSGIVVAAKHTRGMGNFVIIRHSGNITTIYGHLSKIYAKKGQFVRQGDIIGLVGKTGNANYRDIQPHLHFEVRQKGVPQDPLKYVE